MSELKVVGKSKRRYDGLGHVTGEATYVDDVFVPGTLAVKVLRSPVHKGVITKLDTNRAEKLPGVHGVITWRDVPCNTYGYLTLDQKVLADTDVRYKGEPIAAVAADTVEIANEALSLIELGIEKQTPVFDPVEAVKPDAPKVRPEGNVLMVGERPYRQVYNGDIEKGFAQADEIIENDFFFPSQEHAPMEPQVSLAVPTQDSRLTIYTVTQGMYFLLKQIQRILGQGQDVSERWSARQQYTHHGLGFSDIKYISCNVGGAFGGKTELHADAIAALMALKTGKPCKWRWTREEEQLYSARHSPWLMHFKDGVTKDGRIVARQIFTRHDAGAYTGLSSYVVDKHAFYVAGPYHLPNVEVKCQVVYTNKVPTGAIRGFGVTPGTYACEIQMNMIAEKMGIDPWELRFINAMRNGDQLATRTKLDSVYLIECMQKLAEITNHPLEAKFKAMNSDPREA
ncbi:MAG: xanthine dehydrogenase family protein molybdopterin-binding subunit [Thermodesulfobacteriota bacterium]